jgi:3-hydroxyacyl-[acyl-carrier-protein] dehydratase
MHSETRFAVPPDHPAFAGHFPDAPIVPGVLLLDAAVHAIQQGQPAQICEIGTAKFLSPVGPGETLTISSKSGASGTHFEIHSGARKVATGTLTLRPSS